MTRCPALQGRQRAVLTTLVLLLGTASPTTRARAQDAPPAPPACTFANPLAPGADPSVLFHDGLYYSAVTGDDDRSIDVYRSPSLTGVLREGGPRDSARVWQAPDEGWNTANVWAPELHVVDGRWYLYYTAGREGPEDAPFIHQRIGVLEALTGDPLGPYDGLNRALDSGGAVTTRDDDVWAIDVTVRRLGGALYAAWSGWDENTTEPRTEQRLYVARMSDPTTVASERVQISAPDRRWEDGPELDLQEGPQFLTRGDGVFVVYSTRESWTPEYRLGMLRLRAPDADPTDPASYTKVGPVFQAANGVYGVGHNTFTVSPDGTEDWIVYHGMVTEEGGWDDRVLLMQPFVWNADGSPYFAAPVPPGQPVPVPSGECP